MSPEFPEFYHGNSRNSNSMSPEFPEFVITREGSFPRA